MSPRNLRYNNATSGNEDFDKEQQRIQAKRDRLQQIANHRTKIMYGSKEDKAELQLMEKKKLEDHVKAKHEHDKRQKEELDRLVENADRFQQKMKYVEQQRQDARREYLMQIKQENMRMAEERRAQRTSRQPSQDAPISSRSMQSSPTRYTPAESPIAAPVSAPVRQTSGNFDFFDRFGRSPI